MNLGNQVMYGDWGIITIIVICHRKDRIRCYCVDDEGDLHILDVRAKEIQQTLEAKIYL